MAKAKKTDKFVLWDNENAEPIGTDYYMSLKEAENDAIGVAMECEAADITVYKLVPVVRVHKKYSVVKEKL